MVSCSPRRKHEIIGRIPSVTTEAELPCMTYLQRRDFSVERTLGFLVIPERNLLDSVDAFLSWPSEAGNGVPRLQFSIGDSCKVDRSRQ